MKRQKECSSANGFILFIVPHLFCCVVLSLLLLSDVSLNFNSPVWLVMGGGSILLGIAVLMCCAKHVFWNDNGVCQRSCRVTSSCLL
jgi:hypothetical protein